jgi:hypothetical protein
VSFARDEKFGESRQTTAHVEWWGAVADGTIDSTLAIKSALRSGARCVRVGRGPFLVSDTLEINTQGIVLEGSAKDIGGIEFADATGKKDLLHILSCGNIEVKYLRFIRRLPSKESAVIRISDSYSVTVTSCGLGDACSNDGIVIESVHSESNKIYIRDCAISKVSGDGIRIYSKASGIKIADVFIVQNYVSDCGGAGCRVVGNFDGIFIDGNELTACSYSIYFDGTDSVGLNGSNKIRNNDLDGCENGGEFLNTGAAIFEGNWHSGSGPLTFTGCAGFVISSCNFQGPVVMNGCTGMEIEGYFAGTNSIIDVNPYNGVASRVISIRGTFAFRNHENPIVKFGDGPVADQISLILQIDSSNCKLISGLCTNLTMMTSSTSLLSGSVILGNGNLLPSASAGFPYIPVIDGVLEAVPINIPGFVPIVYDRSTKKLCIYYESKWVEH